MSKVQFFAATFSQPWSLSSISDAFADIISIFIAAVASVSLLLQLQLSVYPLAVKHHFLYDVVSSNRSVNVTML